LHRPPAPGDFVNRRAATSIPASDMARGFSVAHSGRPVTPEMFNHAHQLGNVTQTVHPDIAHQAAAAPHPSGFATRHEAPPITTHTAVQPIHPGTLAQPREALPPGVAHGAVEPFHPGMTRPTPSAMPFHPAPAAQPREALPPRPPAANFRPPMPPVYQPHAAAPPRPPVESYRPPMPAYHPPAPQYRPQMPAYHPQAPQYHPAAQQPHAAPSQHQSDHDRNHP